MTITKQNGTAAKHLHAQLKSCEARIIIELEFASAYEASVAYMDIVEAVRSGGLELKVPVKASTVREWSR